MTEKRAGRPTSPILPSLEACTVRLGFRTPTVHLPFLRYRSALLALLFEILVQRLLTQIAFVDING